ncbi:MAG: HAD family hydrolase [Salinibacterium sp.]|nr:HAD family hydrolase [Salinibacterium sp.]
MAVIRLALFDLDDTLFHHRQAVRAGIAAHVATTLPGIDASSHLDRWDALEEQHYHRYLSGEIDYLGQRRARARDFMAGFGVTLGEDAAAEDWFETYLVEYVRAWTLFDDALPCLSTLAAQGVRVGMITNGIPSFQQPKLDTLELSAHFEHVVTSGEFGVPKPDPAIYLHTCNLFGVDPAEAAYVGDRLHTDALGAAGAGLLGVWLDREATASPAETATAADSGAHIIASLHQLAPLLARS